MPRHAPAHARHTWGIPWQFMNPSTKYGAIDLFTLECWHGASPCHFSNVLENFLLFRADLRWSKISFRKVFIVFLCIGCVISQNSFRNFQFEIFDYFKCRSNRSSRPHLNQMLKFLLNHLTTNSKGVECILTVKGQICYQNDLCSKWAHTCETFNWDFHKPVLFSTTQLKLTEVGK